MNIPISNAPFDSNGNPCDYKDEEATIWIYLGKRYGFEEWEGIPKED